MYKPNLRQTISTKLASIVNSEVKKLSSEMAGYVITAHECVLCKTLHSVIQAQIRVDAIKTGKDSVTKSADYASALKELESKISSVVAICTFLSILC